MNKNKHTPSGFFRKVVQPTAESWETLFLVFFLALAKWLVQIVLPLYLFPQLGNSDKPFILKVC